MKLLRNTLIESTEPNSDQTVERVLDTDAATDRVFTIRIDRPNALPQAQKLSDIEAGIAAGRIRTLTVDPFAYLQQPDQILRENHRRRRDQAMEKIRKIIEAPDRQAYFPENRGRLVDEVVKKTRSSKKDIYKYLIRFWQTGMTPNGVLPRFHRCGKCRTPGKVGATKLGRPRKLTKLNGAPAGINVGPEVAEKLQKGYRMFYCKAPEDGGQTKRMAYEKTLQKFFYIGFESDARSGALVPALPPAEDLPSFDQFLDWGPRGTDFKETLIRRLGERRFNLRSRAVLGDSALLAFGPGTLYQSDGTTGDTWVVSALNRSRRLGRPTVILIVDSFSHMIAGYYAGLDTESFFTAGLAVQNAFSDKVAHCARFGITITPDDWPSCDLCEGILADRGEFRGHAATNLVKSLGISIASTSPFRADLKGTVERTLRSMNDLLIHNLPGAVRKPRERGERDPRLAAMLTMHEFEFLLIHAILQHNRRRIEGFRLQKDMIAGAVEPRPTAMWEWGIRNRSGHLRAGDPAVIRANLLPFDRATVTYRGISFRRVLYSCDRALREHWFERARASGSWQRDAAYDPRLVDTIYLRLPDQTVERCDLLQVDHRFRGLCWGEVDDFFLSEEEARDRSRTADRQALANFHAPVEDVVKRAAKAASVANEGLTKAEQLRNVRKNREAERRLNSTSCVSNATAGLGPLAEVNGEEVHAKAGSGNRAPHEYVPPPSPVEMLRKQREATWGQT
jgi:putative transposase